MTFPSFETFLPDLDNFIHELVQEYQTEEIRSWESLEKRVNIFFTTENMDQVEGVATGWRKMASYADGITLVHVMCVFLGLFMTPEFLGMPRDQQGMMKWIILFHDIEKEVQNGTLVRLLPDWTRGKIVLSFVYPPTRYVSPNVKAFIDLAVGN